MTLRDKAVEAWHNERDKESRYTEINIERLKRIILSMSDDIEAVEAVEGDLTIVRVDQMFFALSVDGRLYLKYTTPVQEEYVYKLRAAVLIRTGTDDYTWAVLRDISDLGFFLEDDAVPTAVDERFDWARDVIPAQTIITRRRKS